ncbi:hypothetical protein PPERSA_00803 [Pseudocohnilembus persalinus]|uniref:TmcB/TmcC TPR repeats domain-containing protein n=1 Tax=Pseudocohnilembus persalinus TaxID=266149 RepID=A0A0V0QFT0_PSEPJ|nr:hypothetical protein PPERSA_00803 [Pseudocohnilembus persalinus]|eukprot:KRX01055.1 hypothetical protein PPERSA_00803 [Pseudocohnilembus persalinus]
MRKEFRYDLLLADPNKYESLNQAIQQLLYLTKILNYYQTSKDYSALLDAFLDYHKTICKQTDCPAYQGNISQKQIKRFVKSKYNAIYLQIRNFDQKLQLQKDYKNQNGVNIYVSEQFVILLYLIESIYVSALSRFPACILLRINHALFLLDTMMATQQAMQELEIAVNEKPYLDEQFMIYRYNKLMEEQMVEQRKNQNKSEVAMELNSDSHIKEFMKLIEISASDHSDFWSQLSEDVPDLTKLQEIGLSAYQSSSQLQDYWLKMNKMNIDIGPNIMRQYVRYLLDVLHDKQQAYEISQKLKDSNMQSLERAKLITNINDFTKEPVGLIAISGEDNVPSFQQGIQFFGTIRQDKYFKLIGYMVIDSKSHVIQNVSSNCISLFGLNIQIISRDSIKITDIVPDIFENISDYKKKSGNQVFIDYQLKKKNKVSNPPLYNVTVSDIKMLGKQVAYQLKLEKLSNQTQNQSDQNAIQSKELNNNSYIDQLSVTDRGHKRFLFFNPSFIFYFDVKNAVFNGKYLKHSKQDINSSQNIEYEYDQNMHPITAVINRPLLEYDENLNLLNKDGVQDINKTSSQSNQEINKFNINKIIQGLSDQKYDDKQEIMEQSFDKQLIYGKGIRILRLVGNALQDIDDIKQASFTNEEEEELQEEKENKTYKFNTNLNVKTYTDLVQASSDRLLYVQRILYKLTNHYLINLGLYDEYSNMKLDSSYIQETIQELENVQVYLQDYMDQDIIGSKQYQLMTESTVKVQQMEANGQIKEFFVDLNQGTAQIIEKAYSLSSGDYTEISESNTEFYYLKYAILNEYYDFLQIGEDENQEQSDLDQKFLEEDHGGLGIGQLKHSYFVAVFFYTDSITNNIAQQLEENRLTNLAMANYTFFNNALRQGFIDQQFSIQMTDLKKFSDEVMDNLYEIYTDMIQEHSKNLDVNTGDYNNLFSELFNDDVCDQYELYSFNSKTACQNYDQDIFGQGLSSVLTTYFENFRYIISMYNQLLKDASINIGITVKNIYTDTGENKILNIINSNESYQISTLQDDYLRKIYQVLKQKLKESIQNQIDFGSTIRVTLFISFTVVLILAFLFFWIPLMGKIQKDVDDKKIFEEFKKWQGYNPLFENNQSKDSDKIYNKRYFEELKINQFIHINEKQQSYYQKYKKTGTIKKIKNLEEFLDLQQLVWIKSNSKKNKFMKCKYLRNPELMTKFSLKFKEADVITIGQALQSSFVRKKWDLNAKYIKTMKHLEDGSTITQENYDWNNNGKIVTAKLVNENKKNKNKQSRTLSWSSVQIKRKTLKDSQSSNSFQELYSPTSLYTYDDYEDPGDEDGEDFEYDEDEEEDTYCADEYEKHSENINENNNQEFILQKEDIIGKQKSNIKEIMQNQALRLQNKLQSDQKQQFKSKLEFLIHPHCDRTKLYLSPIFENNQDSFSSIQFQYLYQYIQQQTQKNKRIQVKHCTDNKNAENICGIHYGGLDSHCKKYCMVDLEYPTQDCIKCQTPSDYADQQCMFHDFCQERFELGIGGSDICKNSYNLGAEFPTACNCSIHLKNGLEFSKLVQNCDGLNCIINGMIIRESVDNLIMDCGCTFKQCGFDGECYTKQICTDAETCESFGGY